VDQLGLDELQDDPGAHQPRPQIPVGATAHQDLAPGKGVENHRKPREGDDRSRHEVETGEETMAFKGTDRAGKNVFSDRLAEKGAVGGQFDRNDPR